MTSDDETAREWDATTGVEIAVFKLASYDEEWSQLWDPNRFPTGLLASDTLRKAVLSPDGARAVTFGYGPGGTPRLWDVITNRLIKVLEGHKDDVHFASFSDDSARIATASFDRTARIWNSKTGAPLIVLQGHKDLVSSAIFSPDGTRVVTTSGDNTSRVWNATSGVEVFVLGHDELVTTPAFSADGTRIMTASRNNNAHLWDSCAGRGCPI